MSRQQYFSLQNEGHLKHYKTSLQRNNDYFQHFLENLGKDTHWFQLSILLLVHVVVTYCNVHNKTSRIS